MIYNGKSEFKKFPISQNRFYGTETKQYPLLDICVLGLHSYLGIPEHQRMRNGFLLSLATIEENIPTWIFEVANDGSP